MHHNSPGSVEVLEQHSPGVGLLHTQHVQRALAAVDVVQVLGHPVEGQTLHAFVLRGQQCLALWGE